MVKEFIQKNGAVWLYKKVNRIVEIVIYTVYFYNAARMCDLVALQLL